jgi:hypothetical protein
VIIRKSAALYPHCSFKVFEIAILWVHGCTPFSETPGRKARQVERIACELAIEIFLIAPWSRVPCHGRDCCFSQGFQLLDNFGQLPTVAYRVWFCPIVLRKHMFNGCVNLSTNGWFVTWWAICPHFQVHLMDPVLHRRTVWRNGETLTHRVSRVWAPVLLFDHRIRYLSYELGNNLPQQGVRAWPVYIWTPVKVHCFEKVPLFAEGVFLGSHSILQALHPSNVPRWIRMGFGISTSWVIWNGWGAIFGPFPSR